jgi:hypothetical protein
MKSRLGPITPADVIPLTIKGRGIRWTPDLRRLFDRRLEKITELYPDEILAIAASLEDANGLRGGIDKACRLNLVLRRRGPVSVSASSASPEVAVAKAVSRARGVVLRKIRGTKHRNDDRRSPRG